MSDYCKRMEIVDNLLACTAMSNTQWFLENPQDQLAHPITHNNKLTVFICGEKSFADIEDQLLQAEHSIDICCWGFDPGMELNRKFDTWPRGLTFGDLLINKGKSGVKVRLLVWFDINAVETPFNPRNMPGRTHDLHPFRDYFRDYFFGDIVDNLNASNSLDKVEANGIANGVSRPFSSLSKEEVVQQAREEYCSSWYYAAFKKMLKGITICTRHGSATDIKASLATEQQQPAGLTQLELEKFGMVHLGTHHQKTILIDFAHKEGSKAVGYVMGLNCLTDYWDTESHDLDNLLREQGGRAEANERVQTKKQDKNQNKDSDQNSGFSTLKPYQDYACRLDGGSALIDIHNNFVTAWERVDEDRKDRPSNDTSNQPVFLQSAPPALLRKLDLDLGHCSVQIVRTQPEEQDKSVKSIYWQATDIAALAGGYLYLENQYFQYEEWALRLMEKRQAMLKGWKLGAPKAGKTMKDMPLMHIFLVTSVPEREAMIPRTYDMLAVLGQQEAMTGQNDMINTFNEHPAFEFIGHLATAKAIQYMQAMPIVEHANSIYKPDILDLEHNYRLKIATATLQVSGLSDYPHKTLYREIYIHSKLMLVDDVFLTMGSANLNQRSMAVDSELNLATDNTVLARDLRERIWNQHSGQTISGGDGSKAEIAAAFKNWTFLMGKNKKRKDAGKFMTGFLLPLEDNRSSTVRLG